MNGGRWVGYVLVAGAGVALTAVTGNGLVMIPFVLGVFLAEALGVGRGSAGGHPATEVGGGSVDYSIIPTPTPGGSQDTGEIDYSIGPGLMAVVVVGGVVVGFMVLAVFAVAILSFL